ncbi:MAG: aminoacyl-histidine dipeptidase [Spirochaetales bacterium]|nr:aminoacyl-histidine dipeptidase [Spirochaetales bacterium]
MTDRTQQILEIFSEISAVPRQSGNRLPIRNWLTRWADKQGFSWKTDHYDNVLIQVPPTAGYEDRAPVILQGHSDMVCEKTPDSDHDFTSDPLELYTEGEWLRARNTTLGADNGIALAMAFDLALNREVEHPPLEILITSDEEIGLDGANALKGDFLTGRRLINIDSEDEGVFTVGCAGGSDCLFDFEGEWQPGQGSFYEIILDGLAGGHSGMEINRGRGSALVMAGRIFSDLAEKEFPLAGLESGSGATNAISRQARILVVMPEEREAGLREILAGWEEVFKGELGQADPNLTIELRPIGKGEQSCLTPASAQRLSDLLLALPHGVAALSREIDDLVETSSNLAAVKQEGRVFHFFTSQRSSVMSRLNEINRRTEAAARLGGCSNIRSKNKYPAWQPDWQSPLLAKSREVYKALFGKEPVVEVIHAGLETGVIGSKYEGMDMISLGPTIEHPHSPEERLNISSLFQVYRFITE